MNITGYTFEIGVICVLSYSMFGVNRQLALFFEQVGRSGYLKKTIVVYQVAFFLIVIHWDVMSILMYFIEVNKIYFYVAGWLNSIMFEVLFLMITMAFLFLGDLGYEARTARVRPETTRKIVNPNINISTAKDSAETSLLQDNLAD